MAQWFKDTHGLGINRASVILSAAFKTGLGWDKPDALLDHLWKKPALRSIYNALESYVTSLSEDVVVGPRKMFSGFSRQYQFVAARPVKNTVRIGIAVDPVEHQLEPSKASDAWSDRLKSVIVVSSVEEIDANVTTLIQLAWESS